MISGYMEEASAPMFLSGFFMTPPENIHDTEKVTIDIERDDEDIAIVLQSISEGARENVDTKYVSKDYTPPIFDEKGTISSFTKMNREAGNNPFVNPDFAAAGVREAFRVFRKLERKIRRSIELMSSQVLQTGTITLTDSSGVGLYTLDYQAKATHMATVPVTWATDGSTGDPLGDLEALATVVRRDGKRKPDRLIFGTSAMNRFLANAKVKEALQRDGNGLGQLAPEVRGEGATFRGWIWIGHYRYEIWMYDAYYRNPVTSALTPYVSDDNIIMMCSDARLDLSYGSIPILVPPEQRVMPYLPPRMSDGARGLDLTTNAWVSSDGKHVYVSAGTRPLVIPTAIDTFARLDVTA